MSARLSEYRSLTLLVVALALVVGSVACREKVHRQDEFMAEGRYSVRAPGAFSDRDSDFDHHQASWNVGDTMLTVSWFDVDARGFTPELRDQIYDGLAVRAGKTITGVVRETRDVDVGGQPGRETVLDGALLGSQVTMRLRVAVVGSRVYMLTAIGPDRPSAGPARAFFESFAIIAPEAAAPVAGAGLADFTRQVLAADGFAVDAPGAPSHTGGHYLWTWPAELGKVSVDIADEPAAPSPADFAKVLDRLRDRAILPDQGAKRVWERQVDVPGATTAREVEWRRATPEGELRGVARVLIVGARTFTVAAESVAAPPDLDAMRSFVATFALVAR